MLTITVRLGRSILEYSVALCDSLFSKEVVSQAVTFIRISLAGDVKMKLVRHAKLDVCVCVCVCVCVSLPLCNP